MEEEADGRVGVRNNVQEGLVAVLVRDVDLPDLVPNLVEVVGGLMKANGSLSPGRGLGEVVGNAIGDEGVPNRILFGMGRDGGDSESERHPRIAASIKELRGGWGGIDGGIDAYEESLLSVVEPVPDVFDDFATGCLANVIRRVFGRRSPDVTAEVDGRECRGCHDCRVVNGIGGIRGDYPAFKAIEESSKYGAAKAHQSVRCETKPVKIRAQKCSRAQVGRRGLSRSYPESFKYVILLFELTFLHKSIQPFDAFQCARRRGGTRMNGQC